MSHNSKLTPNLRFPEFSKAGEWEATTIADVCDLNPGCAVPEKFRRFSPSLGGNSLVFL